MALAIEAGMTNTTVGAGETAVWNNRAHVVEIHASGCACLRKCNPRKGYVVIDPGEIADVLDRGDKVRRAPCAR